MYMLQLYFSFQLIFYISFVLNNISIHYHALQKWENKN